MGDTDILKVKISRNEAGFIWDILDVRAEQYEITADYCVQNDLYDAEGAEELNDYVSRIKRGFEFDDMICEVNDAREAMDIAKSIRALQDKLEAYLH